MADKPIRKTTGKGGNYRKTKSGAGMTAKGVAAHRRANPGSKLKTAVTGKVKAAAKTPSGASRSAHVRRSDETVPKQQRPELGCAAETVEVLKRSSENKKPSTERQTLL